jgi:hypothetical protein
MVVYFMLFWTTKLLHWVKYGADGRPVGLGNWTLKDDFFMTMEFDSEGTVGLGKYIFLMNEALLLNEK